MDEAIKRIKNARRGVVFTGAGVSVESGIPPFTGAGGLWNQYDPKFIELDFFYGHPTRSWQEMKKIFFTCMDEAQPNKAHRVIAQLEKRGGFQGVITQNIDGLHQKAGSKNVQEFHGTIHQMHCIACGRKYKTEEVSLDELPPKCFCGGVLKPDFVFYGEGINPAVYTASQELAEEADVMLVVGTAGQVMPACSLPLLAKQFGATIIEVNTLPSAYTDGVSDFFFQEKATEFFSKLEKAL
ncbi:SIR2 family NAD-dependent protein deacylase [Candidatus Avelusimicrobium facis]|uniref:SIR2 family NAD-dependent protein deacylase n=1 Tax=Candidatus Avelusimicrobium facis TaxID=3416203 RepID=UPI003D10C2A1